MNEPKFNVVEATKSLSKALEKTKVLEKIPELPTKPQKIGLDKYDKMYIENSLLKEQNEKLRQELRGLQLRIMREGLHDHLVDKYGIDLDKQSFQVEDGKLLIITEK